MSKFNQGHAIGFDDDHGVGSMSSVHLTEACPSCTILLANFGIDGALITTLVWDQESDFVDADRDGLGPTLEADIGTSDQNADTDQDGISDYAELFGFEDQKFPLMGADPSKMDLFLEADWQECTDPTCNGNLDLGQLGWTPVASDIQSYTDNIAKQYGSDMSPVRVHVDVGHANTNNLTWYNWDDWGGATRGDYFPTGTPKKDIHGVGLSGCEGASFGRRGLFHFAVSFAPYSGHAHGLGSCMVVGNNNGNTTDIQRAGRTLAHETGHMLGLTHGGRPTHVGMNYKPNYFSLMNYAYQWDADGFSSGTGVSLDPTFLDETVGLSGMSQKTLQAIQKAWCPTGSCVNLNTGAVDWNRDGVFSPSNTRVQGAVAIWDNADQGHSEFENKLTDPVMSWVSVGGTIGDQLWIVGRSVPGNVLQFAWTPRGQLDNACGPFGKTELDEYFRKTDCALYSGLAGNISGNKVLNQGPGLAEIGAGKMIVVWQGASGTLTSNLMTINGGTGALTVGANVVLPGAVTALGDVSAVSTASGVVTVWARGGSPLRLKQWKYQSGAWTGPVDQLWADGSAVSPQYGIGATMGYQDNSSTAKVYAAIPTIPSGVVEFARQETTGKTAGRWTKLAAWTVVGQPVASGRPGIAYQHRTGQATSLGRFYMAFNQASCAGVYGDAPCAARIMMTEGNLATGTTRRLQWINPDVFGESGMPGGITLLDDITRDKNLRGAANHQPDMTHRNAWFLPVADGIYKTTFQDNNDSWYVTGTLRASLGLDGGTWPNGVLPALLP
ncbi:MAG: hypothetical protein ABJA82_01770 [Myxococcales bacterium]